MAGRLVLTWSEPSTHSAVPGRSEKTMEVDESKALLEKLLLDLHGCVASFIH